VAWAGGSNGQVSKKRASVDDVHRIASSMPHVTVDDRKAGLPVYQVGGKSFVFFRTQRTDAVDPESGERYDDVIVFWVDSEDDNAALTQDSSNPFFTTLHFDRHPSVLVRGSELGEITVGELTEVVQDAWLAQASPTRASKWLQTHGLEPGKADQS
jgi:hypothetical protein